jgi:hypothetical protein
MSSVRNEKNGPAPVGRLETDKRVIMMSRVPLTAAQSNAIRQTARSHHVLIEAQAHLHRALERAQGRREMEWAGLVASELRAARDKIAAHRDEVRGSSGLYHELQFEAPRLIPRVERMAALLQQLESEAARLAGRVEVICGGDARELRGVRPEAERMLQTLRTLMFQENDLIFERFREIGSPD